MRKHVCCAAIAGLSALLLSGCATSQRIEPAAKHGKSEIILVGHGVPANDYPGDRLREFFRLSVEHHDHIGHEQHEREQGHEQDAGASRYEELEREIRNWPRTPENDPYKYAVEQLADRLSAQTGRSVRVAFNEFCAPTIIEVIDAAVRNGASEVIVLTTMMTPGSGHSEVDIPQCIDAAQNEYPNVKLVYAWPYDEDLLANTLARQISSLETGQPQP